MKFYRYLKSINETVYLIDCLLEEDTLSVGLGYLSSNLPEYLEVYDEENNYVTELKLAECFLKLSNPTVEINLKIEINNE
jgi:hypothetical protein